MRAFVTLGAFATLASGCALNAALEIEMTLPWMPGDAPRASVEVCDRPARCAFDEGWAEESAVFELAPSDVECDASAACNVRMSVLTEETDLERLRIRVRFCDDDCDASTVGPSMLHYELERPFTHGERTYWDPGAEPFFRVPDAQPTTPPPPITVSRCEIRPACWPDTAPSPDLGYCDADGARRCL